MNKWYIRFFILLAYCVPYTFLAIYGDAIYGTMLLYVVAGTAFFVLYHLCIRTKNIAVCFAGNLLTFSASFLTAHLIHLEKMEWYFKPFNSQSLLITLSFAIFMIQLLTLAYRKRKR